ncbi:unnamed protein product [Linum tenue]|uniref:Cellulose synthase-like protein G3 n=1 Tax=Linum tenue TaxID=586396 RepID=A0AAV0M6V9_9ROSI|nr:unnamed protein product [Linum tenue]
MEDDPTTRRRRSSALHTADRWPITPFNRLFAPIYLLAVLALLYRHVTNLLVPATSSPSSFTTTLALLVADLVLAFMWATTQVFRMNPIRRREAVENLNDVVAEEGELPGVDVFICTADPYKEPPLGVVNTALSVMAYDYPRDRLAVYVSDDGGSALTLFAFVEAAKFAARWLPFCERNRVVERNPAVYFGSNRGHPVDGEVEEIKTMYESMKHKVEHVVEAGKVDDQFIDGPKEQEAFGKWSDKFTKHNHPTFIQVLLDSKNDKDVDGHVMPNLIYVSREKSSTSQHHFKAGALNVLLRVSATMTNQPIVLTLDCDMYSNDPATPRRAMCYLCDPKLGPENSAFVQFPQKYHGINENDIYAGEFQRLFQAMPMGADGLCGPHHVGTGCFFRRRAFFGSPSSPVAPEIPEVGPDHVVGGSVRSGSVLELAHRVAECGYENQTSWGSKIGYRYGSLVEDYYTGYRLHCEGWKSVFCCPQRPAFLGDAPISLADMLNQQKRWDIGLLEVAFSRFSTLTYGVRSSAGFLMGFGYCQNAFWPSWSIPVIVYSFLPQLALLNGLHIFPKATEPWFWLYPFLFLGAYAQDMLDFLLVGGTFQRWWSDQRIWLLRGLTCHLFAAVEYFLKYFLGIAAGFNVTSKVIDEEQSKRYDRGTFEFGVHSPMFVPPTAAALISLLALVQGLAAQAMSRGGGGWRDAPLLQLFVAGFGVVNGWPIYEAVGWRSDGGRMPVRTVVVAVALAWGCYVAAGFVLK